MLYIALLEDDCDQSLIIAEWLREAGHKCDTYNSGRMFIKGVKRNTYDILVLDWIVPDMSGLDVLYWVRENVEWMIPVIFTTQMDREEDVVRVLNEGADDYMAKPIKHRELIARISALGRRSLNTDEGLATLEFDPFRIDRQYRTLQKNGVAINLTNIEFDLTVFLFRNFGRILSRGYILENVWGRNADVNTRTVDTHVSRVRKKLGICEDIGWRLTPIYQHGYRLEKLMQMPM